MRPAKLAWTTTYRKAHKKDQVAEAARKKRRGNGKAAVRSIAGVSMEVINKKRTEKPEVGVLVAELGLELVRLCCGRQCCGVGYLHGSVWEWIGGVAACACQQQQWYAGMQDGRHVAPAVAWSCYQQVDVVLQPAAASNCIRCCLTRCCQCGTARETGCLVCKCPLSRSRSIVALLGAAASCADQAAVAQSADHAPVACPSRCRCARHPARLPSVR
jgi:hypothetical protein